MLHYIGVESQDLSGFDCVFDCCCVCVCALSFSLWNVVASCHADMTRSDYSEPRTKVCDPGHVNVCNACAIASHAIRESDRVGYRETERERAYFVDMVVGLKPGLWNTSVKTRARQTEGQLKLGEEGQRGDGEIIVCMCVLSFARSKYLNYDEKTLKEISHMESSRCPHKENKSLPLKKSN